VSDASPSSPEDTEESAPRIALGVWELAWPTMISFVLQTVVGFVDFVIVAALGTEAVAAVGVAHQFYFAIFAILASVSTGTVALVARFTGAGDHREADRILRLSAVLAIVLGVLMMGMIPLAPTLIGLFGVEQAVIDLGSSYLVILLLFNVPFSFGVIVSMGVRGAGDVRTPLVIGVVLNVVNIVLNYGLVYGRLGLPEMGTDGSALGTGIAMSVGALIWLELWRRDWLAVSRNGWVDGFNWERVRRIVRIGIPTAIEQAAFQVGLLLFLRIVARFGTDPVSAYLIGVRILAFSFVPGIGFAQAGSTLVGQHLGAEEPDAAARAGWRATGGAMAVMGGVGLLIILTAPFIAKIFGAAGQNTVDLTVTFIYILGAVQPLMAMEFALGGSLRGAGDTRFPLFVILTGLFAVRLGGATLVADVFAGGVVAVWCCLLMDYTVKAIMLTLRFRSGVWQHAKV
jgi:putative MATE family efflux protein